MNKLELIRALSECDNGISKIEASKIVNMFFDEMVTALQKGDRVEIRGLCSFYVKNHKAYIGRNPRSGGKVKVESKKLPFFKAGKELKEMVDY